MFRKIKQNICIIVAVWILLTSGPYFYNGYISFPENVKE